MLALLTGIIFGNSSWEPREIALVERSQTQTVVRWGGLPKSDSGTLAFKQKRVFVLAGFTVGNMFGDFAYMSPNGRELAVTGLK